MEEHNSGTSATDAPTRRATHRSEAPLNIEEQCGVEMAEGSLCRRSLDCRRHGMGKKRTVPGRSAPFDTLLMAFLAKKDQNVRGQ